MPDQHIVDGRVKFGLVCCYAHALARGETISFDHDRKPEVFFQHRTSLFGCVACSEAGSRNRMASRELLGEYLAAFQSSGRGSWADKAKPARAKRLGDSSDQRSFRTDHCQVGSNQFGEACETIRVIYIGRDARGDLVDRGATRCAVELRGVWTASEFPGESVFAAPGTDYEDSHDAAIV